LQRALSLFKPSHTEPLSCALFDYNQRINILRDDLIHPVVSGNKWRKLKFFIDHIQQTGQAPIVTFGGAYSNHLVATSFAGKYFNIPTHAFVRGDETREFNAYEQCCLSNGMTLQHVSRTAYRDKETLFKAYVREQRAAVFLDEGGDHALALKGCAEIFNDLQEPYDYIVLAAGTGTTMEGLVKAVAEKNAQTKIIGISVLKNNLDIDRRLQKYDHQHWEVCHNYHRGKYAKTDAELLAFMDAFKKETGIILDPVYTGKMMLAVGDLLRSGYFKGSGKILLIHTGGVPDLGNN
jgi:1-aminocyclopropane-1-carboxylate deaminase